MGYPSVCYGWLPLLGMVYDHLSALNAPLKVIFLHAGRDSQLN
jgi:hypothetical protein